MCGRSGRQRLSIKGAIKVAAVAVSGIKSKVYKLVPTCNSDEKKEDKSEKTTSAPLNRQDVVKRGNSRRAERVRPCEPICITGLFCVTHSGLLLFPTVIFQSA